METQEPQDQQLSKPDAELIHHFAKRSHLSLVQVTHMLHQALANHLRSHGGHIQFPLKVGLPSYACIHCAFCFENQVTEPNVIPGQF